MSQKEGSRLPTWRQAVAGGLMVVGAVTVVDRFPGVDINPWDHAKQKAKQALEHVNPIKPDVKEKILEALPGKIRDLGDYQLAERPWTIEAYKEKEYKVHIWGTNKNIPIPSKALGEEVTRTNRAYIRTILPLSELPDGSVVVSSDTHTVFITLPHLKLDDVRLDEGTKIDGKKKTKREEGAANHLFGIDKPLIETDEIDAMISADMLNRGWNDSELFERSKKVGGDKISGFTQGIIREVLAAIGVPDAQSWVVIATVQDPIIPSIAKGPDNKDVKITSTAGEVRNL